MALLQILKYGSPVLRQKAKPITSFTPELQKLAEDMLETMYAAPGVGLAANQIGIPIRMCVIDTRPEGKRMPIVLINPKIDKKEGKVCEEEGCLSFPGLLAKTKRARKVTVTAQNLLGKSCTITADGLMGRAFQHEIDHLDGKVFLDLVTAADKKYLQSEIRRRKKEGIW